MSRVNEPSSQQSQAKHDRKTELKSDAGREAHSYPEEKPGLVFRSTQPEQGQQLQQTAGNRRTGTGRRERTGSEKIFVWLCTEGGLIQIKQLAPFIRSAGRVIVSLASETFRRFFFGFRIN